MNTIDMYVTGTYRHRQHRHTDNLNQIVYIYRIKAWLLYVEKAMSKKEERNIEREKTSIQKEKYSNQLN